MKKFVVIVDTQVDFVSPNGSLYVPTAEEIIIPGIEYLRQLDVDNTVGILFTADTHDRDMYAYSEEAKEFPPHCLEGSTGWANVFNADMVDPNIMVYTAKKYVFDMFADPESVVLRDARLSKYGAVEGLDINEFCTKLLPLVDQVEVWGVASDYCVKYAIDGLLLRGFDVSIRNDLCRGISRTMTEVFNEYCEDLNRLETITLNP